MTEPDWLACSDPLRMLDQLRAAYDARKTLLLTAACFARVWPSLPDVCREWQTLLEDVADGRADPGMIDETWDRVDQALDGLDEREFPDRSGGTYDALLSIAAGGWGGNRPWRPGNAAWAAAQTEHARLVREVFGNPFRPIIVDPAWLTPAVQALAQTIYEDRGFAEMPILADALEEAGCANDDILCHCRQTGEHVRGCWVVDLLLGET